jgi:MSHA biogenesis protein MshQ
MFRFLLLLLRALLCTLLLAGVARAGTVNFNGKNVGNCTLSGTTYTCGTAFLGATDTASIFSGYTVIVNGSLQLGWDQGLKMTGTARLETTGNGGIRLSGANPANINITGGTIKAAADFVLGGNRQDITADVIAATLDITGPGSKITGSVTTTGAINLVSRSEITGAVSAGSLAAGADVILGGSVTTTGAIVLQSRTTVAGAVTGGSIKTESGAILNSTVRVDGLADFESGSMVNGNVTAGSLTLRPSGTTITGNVNVSGDVTMGSGTVINGDLVGNNVKTQSSNARINGNALVYSLYFAYGGTVSKVITCKVPGDFPCSCVTYESGYSYSPTCAAAAPSTAHHFQITHGGSALTCQPQTVTVTACANAACTAPHYTSAIKTTLQPGGAEFTVTGGVNNAATVSRSTVGTAALSASGGSNASTCVNTGTGSACNMVFSDSGLVMSVPDHVSMTTASVTVQALKSAPAPNAGKSCVPLVASTTAAVNFSCSYINPANATKLPLALKNQDASAYTSVSCGTGSTGVSLKFDSAGLATANLQYPEVGSMSLSASYTSGNLGASTPTATSFVVAPKEFFLTATRKTTPAMTTGYFEKAGVPFTLTVQARNAAGNVVTNFGRESTAENFALDVKVTEPASGKGTLLGTMGAITAGVSTSDLRFTETGTIEVTARLLRTSGNYMDNATTGFATKGKLTIGRFTPQYYDTVLVVNRHMACSKLTASNRPCPTADGMFTHAKQGFFIQVLAYNGLDSPTPSENYTGALAVPVNINAYTSAGGKTATPDATLEWTSTDAAVARFAFSMGTGTLADESKNLPVFKFNAAYPARILPVTAYLRASDANGVTSERTPKAGEAELTFVSGQLLVGNTFGSQNSMAPVNATAQYYLASGYVGNPLVTENSVAFGTFATFSNCTKALDAGNKACPAGLRIADSAARLELVNGKGVFYIAPPKPAISGTGSAAVSLGALLPHLPSTAGTATFGIYRSGPVIYTREMY